MDSIERAGSGADPMWSLMQQASNARAQVQGPMVTAQPQAGDGPAATARLSSGSSAAVRDAPQRDEHLRTWMREAAGRHAVNRAQDAVNTAMSRIATAQASADAPVNRASALFQPVTSAAELVQPTGSPQGDPTLASR